MGRTMLAENFKARTLNPMCIRAQLEVRALAALTDQHRISADAGTIRTVGGLSVTVVEGDEEQIPELCLDGKLPEHVLPNGAILLTLLFPNLPRFPSGRYSTAPALLMTTG